jgi:hypothetical protein
MANGRATVQPQVGPWRTWIEVRSTSPETLFPPSPGKILSRRRCICPDCRDQERAMRLTKIIATLGPATDSPEMLGQLLDAGVNVFRLNMSHAPHDWVRRVVRDIRAAAGQRKMFAGILLDTQGPAAPATCPCPLISSPARSSPSPCAAKRARRSIPWT